MPAIFEALPGFEVPVGAISKRLADILQPVNAPANLRGPAGHLWEQLYLPALEPIALAAGETLRVRLRSTTSYADGTNVIDQARELAP